MIAAMIDRLVQSQKWLEPLGAFEQKLVGAIYKPFGSPGQRLKSFLHGAWLGHALHPIIVDIPLGAWTVAIIADMVGLTGKVSPGVGDFGVFVGLVAALAAVVTGYNDHHETYGKELRVATAHGLIMTTTTILYAVSFLLRWQGASSSHGLAIWIAVAGYVLLLAGGYFGGDLVFAIGTMVNRNAFATGPEDEYVRVGAPGDFLEGQMKRVDAGDMAVLLVRQSGKLHAIASTCGHAGGPLDEGELHGSVVTCPWHFSQFDVTTGGLRRGPATFAQPALTVRESGEAVEVKLARSLHG